MSAAALHLVPLWTPTANPRVVSLDALIKARAGAMVDAPSSMELRMLDAHGRLIEVAHDVLRPSQDALRGPGWLHVRGQLVRLPDEATALEGVLGALRSPPVLRARAGEPVELTAIPLELDLPGEPHLAWHYRNAQDAPVEVGALFASTRLHVDDRTFALSRHETYNGPAQLPAGRALSGWWSLDRFEPGLRRGRHRFELEILGRRSAAFDHGWDG
jgi:hypothetical protein